MVSAAQLKATEQKRVCESCSAVLSRYNPESLCAPCFSQQRRSAAVIRVAHDDVVDRVFRDVADAAQCSKTTSDEALRSTVIRGSCSACGQAFDRIPKATGRPKAYCDATCRRRARHWRRYEKETSYQRWYWAAKGAQQRAIQRVEPQQPAPAEGR